MLTDEQLTALEHLCNARIYCDDGNGCDRPPSPDSERPIPIQVQLIRDLVAEVRQRRKQVVELEMGFEFFGNAAVKESETALQLRRELDRLRSALDLAYRALTDDERDVARRWSRRYHAAARAARGRLRTVCERVPQTEEVA